MTEIVDVEAAEQFIWANARVLEQHRVAVFRHGTPTAPVVEALRAYRNDDGGFGHALEPDVRGPHSEPASTLHALDVLAEIDALDDAMVASAAAWIGSIANADAGLPFVLPASANYPHAPWMEPSAEGSFLTYAIAAHLWEARSIDPWLEPATEWCWKMIETSTDVGGYGLKFALEFLDAVPDASRATAAIERLRLLVSEDGSVRVEGGTENERLTPLTLSPGPDGRSRALFSADQIAAELDGLERGQLDDGGWMFDWLAWSPGQSSEWRGIVTFRALATLADNGRIQVGAD